MKTYSNVIALLIGIIGTASFGSGFVCKDAGENLTVQMYNYLHREDGTRNPAVMVVSDNRNGTLVKRFGSSIGKRNRANTVQYIISGGAASDKMDFDTLILQVHHKEGRETIADGESASGEMILLLNDEKEVTNLTCERYLTE